MSYFMLSTKIITRSKNQSAVASASYRSNEELYSKEDDEYKRFKERSVDPVSFIMKPDHAPEWTLDREQLWNEVQEKEDKRNSRLAREVLVALPVELNEDQQEDMLREFVKESFVDDGMVADVSIHRDKEHNPHAHIMLTVRPFNEHGEWDMKKKREYLFNENGEKKFKTISSTNWNDLDTLKKWRENYAEKINNYFKSFDIDAEVSHKSYEDQGIEKTARHRLKQNEYFFEKREKERAEREGYEYEPLTYYAKLNRMIDRKKEKLKEIDNELYSLDKVKQSLSKDYTTIRSEHPLSESSSYRFIEKRIGGEVNYQSSLNNLNKLEKWNKALEFQTSKLLSEREVINKATNVLQREPKLTVQAKEQSPQTSIIFLDFAKGDVGADKNYVKAIGASVIDVDKDGLPFNPFALSDISDRNIEDLKDCITCLQSSMGPKQSHRLFQYLKRAFNECGGDVDINKLFSIMEEIYSEENIPYDVLYELFHKLNISGYLPNSNEESFSNLMEQSFILDLHKIQGHMKIKEMLAFFVLQRIYQEALTKLDASLDIKTGSREIRTIVVIDEAHAYLNTRHPVLEKMIRELRSRGVAIFLLSQGYGDLEKEFDYGSQMGRTFILKSDNTKKSIEKALAVGKHSAEKISKEIANAQMGRVYTRSLRDCDKDVSVFDGSLFFMR
ncbi:MobQ family relaxase [Salipaludibacillus sp. CF4.18]|uniref:MobQ family relaxase n=1 Tax=Salipaludibacillus sp. CF4.18 TaxID=3373081 RepID=UPI003EE5EC43